jgi:hypothetical protein
LRFLFGAVVAGAAATTAYGALSSCAAPPETSYGNPNTLDRKNLPGEGGVEPLVCAGDAAPGLFDGGNCPSFAADIYPYFTANGAWKCSAGTCHGGASAPDIPAATPTECLAALKGIAVQNRAYVPSDGGTDPNASSLLCNLQGTCGSRMPKPPGTDPTQAELCKVEAWLKCGAPP